MDGQMKYAILLTGSNAAGKTTAVARALTFCEEDPRVVSIRADNDGRFKGDAQDQRKVLTEIWLTDTPVLVVEGTRINTPLMDVAKQNRDARELTVLMINQTPEVMKAHLIARCAKRNKTFRADYWSYWKLEYEGSKRYPNSFRKHSVKPVVFNMDAEYKVQDDVVDYLQSFIRRALGE